MTEEELKALEEQKKLEEAKKGNPELSEAEALKKLKEDNDKLAKENADLKEAKKTYYDTILNGGKKGDEKPKFRSSNEIREEMIKNSTKNTNLRNWQLSIELDEAVIRETGLSSYLPKGVDENGTPLIPTVQEEENAVRVNETIKECLKEAGTDMNTFTGGDPEAFNAALKKRKL